MYICIHMYVCMYVCMYVYVYIYIYIYFFFFYLDFLSQTFTFTGQQGKLKAISLTPLYHFHPLHRHSDISWVITAES